MATPAAGLSANGQHGEISDDQPWSVKLDVVLAASCSDKQCSWKQVIWKGLPTAAGKCFLRLVQFWLEGVGVRKIVCGEGVVSVGVRELMVGFWVCAGGGAGAWLRFKALLSE